MLELEITFLGGRYVATSEAERGKPEWPPHPARVFSALVANWAETEGPDTDERAMLEWLERLPAPEIVASGATERTAVVHYVPVNDASVVGLAETERRAAKLTSLYAELATASESDSAGAGRKMAALQKKIAAQLDVTAKVSDPGATNPDAALSLLPSGRNRQARIWPSVRPLDPIVTLRWPDIEASPRAVDVLDRLCSRVSRLGHSSSLVSVRACAVQASNRSARWIPDAAGKQQIRWVQQGQLRALESEFSAHQGSRPRSLPKLGVAYRDVTAAFESPGLERRSNLSGEWFVFALPGAHRRLPLIRTVELTKLFRRALIAHSPEPVSPLISGHDPDGRPSRHPHLAVLALPFVANERATGHVLGLGVLLPTESDPDARSAALAALGQWELTGASLTLGRRGLLELERVDDTHEIHGLRRSTWAGACNRWVSATPIALPRHPGDLRRGTAHARNRAWDKAHLAVVTTCRNVGLPEPTTVEVSLAPFLRATERANRYPAFRQGDQTRALVHAAVTFDEPVAGPLVLGSGRFLGLGLMRPVPDEQAS